MEKIALDSYAKVNLYLAVLNRRKDGYHSIKTVFERIGLSDKIILQSRQDQKIKIICSSRQVPKDQTNLAYRSAKLLQDNFKVARGVSIKIIKNIPVGAGLGGGSSNAAAVLSGLNQLWKLKLSQNKLAELAGRIGSDVPFFIYNTSFAQAQGRGEKIKPLKALERIKLWHLLVVPELHVSTPLIYRKWDEFNQKAGLTTPAYNVKILTLALKSKNPLLMRKFLFNALEEVTLKLYPEVIRVKEKLICLGAKATLMSGSGPAVFALISSGKEAVSLCNQLKKEFRFWQVFAVRTC